MVQEKFNELLKALDIKKTSSLAVYAGFDRTNISRIKNGSRIPSASSPTIKKLVRGIYLYADDNNRLDTLCALIGVSAGSSRGTICQALHLYLYPGTGEDDSRRGKKTVSRKKNSPDPSSAKKHSASVAASFSHRLNKVMALTGYTNSVLSQLISVDASLISRYRSGTRSPRSNPEIALRLSEALWDKIIRNDAKEELSKIMSLPAESIDETVFSDWLCETDAPLKNSASAAESLLTAFESYSAAAGIELPSFEDAADKTVLEDSADVYYGYEGLRRSIVRFLGNAVRENASRLLLYSDQPMDWLLSDEAFRLKWASLMNECVKKGIRIDIIHNIDRKLEEMNNAIISWLPLYISGMIRSFYCIKPSGTRFSHTLFLCPGHFCIKACHIIGNEEKGRYYFHTSPKDLALCLEEFNRLMDNSRPLVNIMPKEDMVLPNDPASFIHPGLSTASMSYELAATLSDPVLKQKHRMLREYYERILPENSITEFITLKSLDSLISEEQYFERFPDAQTVTYSPGQYIAHIKSIISLLNQYPNYHVVVLPDVPFANIRIMTSSSLVLINRISDPYISMTFDHPLMCKAFLAYCDLLNENYRINKRTLIEKLSEQYELRPPKKHGLRNSSA